MGRDSLLVFHIAGVAAWLGANCVQFFLTPWFARRPSEETIGWIEATRVLGQRYYNVVGAVVAMTGVALVLDTGYSFRNGFVVVGIATVVVGGLVGVLVFDRLSARHLVALRTNDQHAAGLVRTRTLQVAVLDTLLLLVTMLAMVRRWSP